MVGFSRSAAAHGRESDGGKKERRTNPLRHAVVYIIDGVDGKVATAFGDEHVAEGVQFFEFGAWSRGGLAEPRELREKYGELDIPRCSVDDTDYGFCYSGVYIPVRQYNRG